MVISKFVDYFEQRSVADLLEKQSKDRNNEP